jgi:hypothetical protein
MRRHGGSGKQVQTMGGALELFAELRRSNRNEGSRTLREIAAV